MSEEPPKVEIVCVDCGVTYFGDPKYDWCFDCDIKRSNKARRESVDLTLQKKIEEYRERKGLNKPKKTKKTKKIKSPAKPKKKVGIDNAEPIYHTDRPTLLGSSDDGEWAPADFVPFRGRRGMHVRDYEDWMDEDKLDAARDRLETVKSKYGWVPMSIIPVWYNDKDPDLQKVVDDQFAKGSYGDNKGDAEWVDGTKYAGQFQGLSQFPPRVSKFIVLKWGVPGGNFYDPFGGRLSIPLIAHHLGMNAYATEIWEEVYQYNKEKLLDRATKAEQLNPEDNHVFCDFDDKIEVMYKGREFGLYKQSAMDMSCIPDNSLDLVCSSPPYYETEEYSDDPEQLAGGKSNQKTYEEFLDDQEKVLALLYKKLKNESFIVWCVSDFRRKGVMYPYHADCMTSLTNVGFSLWDVVIYNSGELATLFSTYNEDAGRTAKVHEFALVYKKEG